ncbi:MAG: hypothetical protein HC769_26755 [Cyanobacteria bacterium CRU_2_1]|nr:hypothetical protein [Cyanobacteria bacterium RU_5_0]NJR62110.1 hypothetical protein [Cyanobacteria bacterium CRU_2_1]
MYAAKSEPRVSSPVESMNFSALLDPAILQTARQIYRTYYEVHPDQVRRPIGVAIDRYTHRGKLIFGEKPILLPQECFIPLSQIELGLH